MLLVLIISLVVVVVLIIISQVNFDCTSPRVFWSTKRVFKCRKRGRSDRAV
ncbi:hypothetical protein Hanom_Chr04g00355701 [Helianthus anomalus]